MVFRPASCPIHLAIAAWIVSIQAASAETPEFFRRLIDEGGVSFAFYDPVREPRADRGHTSLQFEVFYDSSFQCRWEDRPAGRDLAIRTQIGNFRYKRTNRIDLPLYLESDDRWSDWLVRHEFDHVAMSVDTRVPMLIEHLCRKVSHINRRLPTRSAIDDALVKGIIEEEVRPRRQAVIDLLIANEHALDVTTRHGYRRLADRQAYFRSLFSEPNLAEHNFPYLAEVGDLLQTKAYREAPLPYDLGSTGQ